MCFVHVLLRAERKMLRYQQNLFSFWSTNAAAALFTF